MARPDSRTPVDVVVLVTRAVANWYATHLTQIEEIVVLDADREQHGLQLAGTLDAAEAAFVGEQREDVALTNRRQEVIGRAETLTRSVRAGARRSFRTESNADDKLNDFGTGAPSTIRTGPVALKSLRRLSYGMRAHSDALSKRVRDFDALSDEVDALAKELASFGEAEATERAETTTAHRKRDQARQACLDYIDEAVLDAEMCQRKYPELLDRLYATFATHNPSRPGGGQSDEDVPEEDITDEDVTDVDTPEPVEA